MESRGAPTIVDLSLPIRDHFRWRREIEHVQSPEEGDIFQTSRMRLLCHAFTHADAPLHFVGGGDDIADMPLDTWAGEAAVLDLADVEANQPIDASLLSERGGHLRPGDIALLRTDWGRKVAVEDADYWQVAPYVTRDGAEWLLSQECRCVGYDFPQDYPIRELVGGSRAPESKEFVTHDVLLSRGVGMVEYLAGLDQIPGERTFFVAAPLRLPEVDGSPVRALAIEWG